MQIIQYVARETKKIWTNLIEIHFLNWVSREYLTWDYTFTCKWRLWEEKSGNTWSFL
jgi:hypothetical protein